MGARLLAVTLDLLPATLIARPGHPPSLLDGERGYLQVGRRGPVIGSVGRPCGLGRGVWPLILLPRLRRRGTGDRRIRHSVSHPHPRPDPHPRQRLHPHRDLHLPKICLPNGHLVEKAGPVRPGPRCPCSCSGSCSFGPFLFLHTISNFDLLLSFCGPSAGGKRLLTTTTGAAMHRPSRNPVGRRGCNLDVEYLHRLTLSRA